MGMSWGGTYGHHFGLVSSDFRGNLGKSEQGGID